MRERVITELISNMRSLKMTAGGGLMLIILYGE